MVFAQRSGDERGTDRGAHHAPLCWHRADQRQIPYETTILAFRHLLEKHNLGEQIFKTVNTHLSSPGMTMRQGTIVDAILIAAPSSTKIKDGKRDQEMHQTKKGNQWYYGMKAHIGVDKDSGLIHSVVTTAANLYDLTTTSELLHGDEELVYGNAGYQGIAKRPAMAGTAAEYRVAMRPGKRRALPDTPDGRLQNLIEAAKAHVRAKLEHPFRVIKQQFGIQKAWLRDLAKNSCKIIAIAALANLIPARRQLLAAD